MASRRPPVWPILSVLVAAYIIVVALPDSYKTWAPAFLRAPVFHYGLDLAGGTQLDFRISEQEIDAQIEKIQTEIATLQAEGTAAEVMTLKQLQLTALQEQKTGIVEAIRTVLERRINALGVSEAVITPSYVGNEKHLLIECPGVVNVEECIATVGKTITLEFKEEYAGTDAEYEAQVETDVAAALRRIRQSGDTLDIVGQDLSDKLGTAYLAERPVFRDQLPVGLEGLWNQGPGGVQRIESFLTVAQQGSDGQIRNVDVPGIYLAQVTRAKTQTGRTVNEAPVAFKLIDERNEDVTYVAHTNTALDVTVAGGVIAGINELQPGGLKVTEADGSARILFLRSKTPGKEEMAASHILIAYGGAQEAAATVTRTKEEALAKAKELKTKLDAGGDFKELAQTESDGPSAKDAGSLGMFGRGIMVPAFEEAAFKLATGQVSEPVETPFGYHIIKSDEALHTTPDTASYDELIVTASGSSSLERANAVLADLQAGNVRTVEEAMFMHAVFFSLEPTGWKDTTLSGKNFRTATVTVDQTTGLPIVQIMFDDEGGLMFQELTKRNVGKRIAIFVGGQLVSAPTVQGEITGGTAVITGSSSVEEARQLATDLNTGAIPAPIYLSGQRTVEATLGATALQTSLQAALVGILIVMVYMILVYRVLGLLADIALASYAVLFIAIVKLPLFLISNQYIVLTLAGMAGIILSLGMAVDANVLIFERMKEELRKGKNLRSAVEVGFKRAWPSIWDSNVSTLITCAILFIIGTSIVRGFALTLSMGVVVSMFTAIVVTKWLILKVADTPLGKRPELFGGKK